MRNEISNCGHSLLTRKEINQHSLASLLGGFEKFVEFAVSGKLLHFGSIVISREIKVFKLRWRLIRKICKMMYFRSKANPGGL